MIIKAIIIILAGLFIYCCGIIHGIIICEKCEEKGYEEYQDGNIK
jgi:hypothetical protein